MFPIPPTLRLLPSSLLLLRQTTLTLAQSSSQATQQQLELNQTLPLSLTSSSSSSSNSTIFTLPTSDSALTISFSLCSAFSSDSGTDGDGSGLRVFVTNNSQIADPITSAQGGDEGDLFEITLNDAGFGAFTLASAPEGGAVAVQLETGGGSNASLEIGVSDTGPLFSQLPSLPLLGDTTSNQALLFSPPYLQQVSDTSTPTYPNYTLPPANLSSPTLPAGASAPNYTLIVGPTASFPSFNASSNTSTDGRPLTACALSALVSGTPSGSSIQESVVYRGAKEGFRTQWLVEGLTPLTNYTAYVVQDQGGVAGPIYFVTKSASFSCPLVHSLPFCPLTAYAMPLPFPPGPLSSYSASNFPSSISSPLIEALSNFTTSLLTFACGRDWYSPVVTCEDCQEAYRTWLCAVQLPRCTEPETTATATSSAAAVAEATAGKIANTNTVTNKKKNAKRADAQTPLTTSTSTLFPATLSQNSTSGPARNPALPSFPGGANWTALLPCLETCNAAERACPYFLGFRCPVPRFNARDSYGVGYVDGDRGDAGGEWVQGGGTTGRVQDRWGRAWCNGPGLAR